MPRPNVKESTMQPRTAITMTTSRALILSRLSQGTVVDRKSGRATSILARDLSMTMPSVAACLAGLERDGAIVRETKGKRTYSIALVDGFTMPTSDVPEGRGYRPKWATVADAMRRHPCGTADAPAVTPAEALDRVLGPLPDPDGAQVTMWDAEAEAAPALRIVPAPVPQRDGDEASPATVAAALFDLVLEKLAEPGANELKLRLSQQIDESTLWRRRAGEAADEAKAYRDTCEGLRREKAELLAQLERFRENAERQAKVILSDVQRQMWDKLMREVPRPGH